ncbi:MAG: lipopolysaccharide biosynthesis protein [bacterium]|nr:lipopolysaccharide biosynthesis protein [bacterium]
MDRPRIDNANTLIANSVWRFADRACSLGTTFLLELLLARNLTPEYFRTIALITVVTNLLLTISDGGLANALIQKKDADKVDFSTAFYFNVCICVLLYAAVFCIAPQAAVFYNDPILANVLRLLTVTIVVSGVRNIVYAHVARTMQFKKYFWATLAGTALSLAAAFVLFRQGLYVWSIVVQQLLASIVSTAMAWLLTGWKPELLFSWQRLRQLFSYGWKLLVSEILYKGYTQFVSLAIGKKLPQADLAIYNRSLQLTMGASLTVNTSIDHVLFPAIASVQNDIERVRAMTKGEIRTGFYVMAPLMIGIFVSCEPLVRVVLSADWLPCVPYIRIFCIMNMFDPIHTANLNAMKSLGRSDLFLKLEIIKTLTGMAALALTIPWGLHMVAGGVLLTSFLAQIYNSFPNRKLIRYPYLEQLSDGLPIVFMALLMGACIYPLNYLGLSDLAKILLQVSLGTGVYIAISHLFNSSEYRYLVRFIKQRCGL